MKNEVFAIGGNEGVTLATYVPAPALDGHLRPMVVICPGGGFLNCSPSEGEPVALHFTRKGYAAAVLTYTTAANADVPSYPQALRDLAESIVLIRSHASEWGVDPDAIAILGFSAGGYVCAEYSCAWEGELLADIGSASERKPNAAVLCYPVVDLVSFAKGPEEVDLGQVLGQDMLMMFEQFHRASMLAFTGTAEPGEDFIEKANPIGHLGASVPPTFIWTTFGDNLVNPLQDLAYAQNLHELGIPCELHVFQGGDHGLSLADATSAGKPKEINAHVANWAELAAEWLDMTFGR